MSALYSIKVCMSNNNKYEKRLTFSVYTCSCSTGKNGGGSSLLI